MLKMLDETYEATEESYVQISFCYYELNEMILKHKPYCTIFIFVYLHEMRMTLKHACNQLCRYFLHWLFAELDIVTFHRTFTGAATVINISLSPVTYLHRP